MDTPTGETSISVRSWPEQQTAFVRARPGDPPRIRVVTIILRQRKPG